MFAKATYFHRTALLIFLLLNIGAFNAHSMTIAITNTKIINVRDTPKGKIIDTLPFGSVVGIINYKGNWVNIIYFKNGDKNNSKTGWVKFNNLKITSVGKPSVSGESCETEYQSGAEVCIEVTGSDLDCDKNYSGEYFDDCEVEIDYEIRTDYRGESSIQAEIECEAEISYKRKESFSSSESEDESESHTLYSHGSDYGSMEIDFSFSSFQKVYNIEIDSVKCEVVSTTLW